MNKYTSEFKRNVVDTMFLKKLSYAATARLFNVSASSVSSWRWDGRFNKTLHSRKL